MGQTKLPLVRNEKEKLASREGLAGSRSVLENVNKVFSVMVSLIPL